MRKIDILECQISRLFLFNFAITLTLNHYYENIDIIVDNANAFL